MACLFKKQFQPVFLEPLFPLSPTGSQNCSESAPDHISFALGKLFSQSNAVIKLVAPAAYPAYPDSWAAYPRCTFLLPCTRRA